MEKLASLGMLPAERRREKSKTGFILKKKKKKKRLMATGLQPGRTVGAKDVGEDSPQVFVVRQLIHHLCQTARCHLEEGRQAPDDAGVDQELGHGGREELQQSKGPNTVPDSLQVKMHETLDDELLKEPITATRDDDLNTASVSCLQCLLFFFFFFCWRLRTER